MKKEADIMSRFVFFSADEGSIELHIDQALIGAAKTVDDLSKLLIANDVSWNDMLSTSSSIDFCDEEGFEPGAAGYIIEEALAKLV